MKDLKAADWQAGLVSPLLNHDRNNIRRTTSQTSILQQERQCPVVCMCAYALGQSRPVPGRRISMDAAHAHGWNCLHQ